MKKRIFAIMLALAMVLVAVPALAEEVEGGEAQTVESIKKECTKCKTKVDNVNEQGLCEKCVSNLKQDNTQQIEVRGSEATGGGEAGGITGGETGGTTGGETGGTTGGETGGSTGGATEGGTTGGGETGGETDGGSTGTGDSGTTPATCTHTWGAPVWAWSDNYSVATATFKCTREGCNESKTLPATVTTSNEYSNCYVYTRYTAKVKGPDGKDYFDSKTTNCRRPDWYYDPCYYNNPCGHWGCGNVCTRYSNCVPCQNYRTTFRVGGYNCLATPKTGDVSVMAPAMLALIGAAGAMLGKKRR